MAVLLLAEVTNGELSLDATSKAVAASKSLGDVTILAAGASAAAFSLSCSKDCERSSFFVVNSFKMVVVESVFRIRDSFSSVNLSFLWISCSTRDSN